MPTTPPTIDTPPTAPQRTDPPATFVTRADAFVAWIVTFVTQITAAIANVYANALEAATSATSAASSATSAAASAAAGMTGSAYVATSASSLSFTAGTKTVALAEAGKAFAAQDEIILIRKGDADARMFGSIDVGGVAGQTLTVSVASEGIVGAGGPFTDWIVIHKAFAQVGATAAEVRALASANVALTPDALGDALAFKDDGTVTGTYTPSHADGPNHKATLGGNITLANLTSAKEGEGFYLRLKQDGTGSRTVSFGSAYKFDGNITPTASTTAGAVDAVSGIVIDSTRYDCTFLKGLPA